MFVSFTGPTSHTGITQVYNYSSTFFYFSFIQEMLTNVWCMPGTVLYLEFQPHLLLQWWITTIWVICRFILPTLIPFLSSISNSLLNIILRLKGLWYIKDCSEHITNITSLESQNTRDPVEASQDADNVLYMTFHKAILIIKGAVLLIFTYYTSTKNYFKISVSLGKN